MFPPGKNSGTMFALFGLQSRASRSLISPIFPKYYIFWFYWFYIWFSQKFDIFSYFLEFLRINILREKSDLYYKHLALAAQVARAVVWVSFLLTWVDSQGQGRNDTRIWNARWWKASKDVLRVSISGSGVGTFMLRAGHAVDRVEQSSEERGAQFLTDASLMMRRRVFVRVVVPSANWLNCTVC